jgi:hypothetical protein
MAAALFESSAVSRGSAVCAPATGLPQGEAGAGVHIGARRAWTVEMISSWLIPSR